MSNDLPSSDIREMLFQSDVSDVESDFSVEDFPDDVDLEDFSSGSDDDFVPGSDMSSTESDEEVVPNPRPRPRRVRNPPFLEPPWIRVHPPEPEFDVAAEFEQRNPGIRNCPPRNSNPIRYFYLFFSTAIWNLMVTETNSFANREINRRRLSGDLSVHSRLQSWVNVTIMDIKKFMALVINMGLIYKNNIEDYWKTTKSQSTPFFPSVMSLRRFQIISSMFHLSSTPRVARNMPGYDPWCKIRKFYDSMNEAFKRYFIPEQNISIDESLIGMKNRCTFIQYMPNKKHKRFGIKKFETCDSKTSYILNVALYSGKDFLAEGEDPFTHKVIMDQLTQCRLLDKGYHIFTDNFYTKLPLARELTDRNTFITGTINSNSKGLCKDAIREDLGIEKSIYFRQDKILLVKYKQKKNRKPVYLITTGLHAEDRLIHSRSGLQAVKPVLINHYNYNMGGVDVSDKSVYHVSCSRTTQKYWKRIFTNFTDMALHNSYILYRNNTDRPMSRSNFLENLVEALVDDQVLPIVPQPGPGGDVAHALVHLPGKKERLCVVCSTDRNVKRKRSYYWCPGCNCGIHPTCFHKLEHYWRPIRAGRKRAHASDDDSD